MLELTTPLGTFKHFKDLYLYMIEENLKEINILKITYVFENIFGSGVYTLEQVKKIIET